VWGRQHHKIQYITHTMHDTIYTPTYLRGVDRELQSLLTGAHGNSGVVVQDLVVGGVGVHGVVIIGTVCVCEYVCM
jgi:hypothetical protein